MKKIMYYLSILLLFSGCSEFAIKEKIIGNYYLIATDIGEDLGLAYHAPDDGVVYGTIIEPTVFAVGHNDKYMIIKQHPRVFPNAPNKKITNYYILPLKKGMDWISKNGLIGPLTLEQYNKQRKELNISDSIAYSIVYEELE